MNADRPASEPDISDALARAGECAFTAAQAGGEIAWQALDHGRLSGVLAECADMRALAARFDGSDVERRTHWLNRARTLTPFRGVHRLRHTENEIWIEERLVRAGTDGSGPIFGFLTDVTERERHREKLVYLACFDELTGHFTRARLRTALAQSLVTSFRDSTEFCFAFIGLDHMAGINHAFGYDVADDILRGVGRRIFDMLESGDTIGRVASSKFGVILDGADHDEARRRLRGIQSELRDHVVSTSSGPVAVTVSVGAVMLPEEARTTSDAFAAAEDALTAAKALGPGGFAFHQPNDDEVAKRRRNLTAAEMLTAALREDRVKLAMQPVVRAEDGDIPVFYECLARVTDHSGKIVPAGVFMPVAEQLGFVRHFDQRVLTLACDALTAEETLRLSVNLSPQTLFDDRWHETFHWIADERPEICERLIIEITESAAIHDSIAAADRIGSIASRGAHVALDDFGAGYTSFSNFKTMRFDLVKIDGSYVRGITTSADNRAFVETLSQLAQHFGMKVVAEMVEDDDAAALLREMGIDYLQGFHFGRPEIAEKGALPCRPCAPF